MKKKILIALSVACIIILGIIIFLYIGNKNKEEKQIDIYLLTNSFANRIEKISSNEEEYSGKRVSVEGYIHIDEYNNYYIARTYAGNAGNTIVGLLLDLDGGYYNKQWVKVIGKIHYMNIDTETQKKIPYIKIESINVVEEHKQDRIVFN